MKARILVYISLIFLLSTSRGLADPISVLYSTDSLGTPESIFAPGEIPYVYLELPSPPANAWNATNIWWISPSLDEYINSFIGPKTDFWFSFGNGTTDTSLNPVTWAGAAETGLWTINATYDYTFGGEGSRSTQFNVVSGHTIPEPATLLLLLAGSSGVLAARFLHKRA